MTYRPVDVVEVRAWGRTVGAVALDPRTRFYAFEYDPAWIVDGADLAPLHLPRRAGPVVFTTLNPDTFYRLPALLADSLPDRFGNALVDRWLADEGVRRDEITPLDRLAYAADRAMGALAFSPPADVPQAGSSALALADLVAAARATVAGDVATSSALHDALRQLIQVGTSAGGARAKAVVAYDPDTDQIRSGQVLAPEGFQHWLVKLDGVSDSSREDPLTGAGPYCRIEYAYYLMATTAGIAMSECRLLPEGPRAHFLTRRFDRTDDGGRIHMQSLCAMAHLDFNLPRAHSYGQYLATVDALGIGADGREQAFRRIVFNVAAANCDDHTKNLAFLLPEGGEWQLSPAFDVTHAYNPRGEWTSQHQMGVNGKYFGISLEDLRLLGDTFLVPGYDEVIADVLAAIDRWPEFAHAAGLGDGVTRDVAVDLAAQRPR